MRPGAAAHRDRRCRGLRRGTLPRFQSSPSREAGRCRQSGRVARALGASPFQSSPSREAGRCHQPEVCSANSGRRPGFNPRPAVRPGAAGIVRVESSAAVRSSWFQSSPSREAGRCLSASRISVPPSSWSFNPRPAVRPGAAGIASSRLGTGRSMSFQSSPSREAGRCLDRPACSASMLSFNPRPAVRPGAAWIDLAWARRRSSGRFNPRPAVRPGAAWWRAFDWGVARQSPFNPRPAVRPGAAVKPYLIAVEHSTFQSSPSREAGRCAIDGQLNVVGRDPVSILAQP